MVGFELLEGGQGTVSRLDRIDKPLLSSADASQAVVLGHGLDEERAGDDDDTDHREQGGKHERAHAGPVGSGTPATE